MSLDPDTIDDEEEIAATFRRLRRNGHSRPEAVQAILDALDVSLAEAKQLLLTSETWAEARSSTGRPGPAETTDSTPGNDPIPPAPG
ncbi:MAG: hypothetical protein ACLFTE_08120 [Salinivenus sp.]